MYVVRLLLDKGADPNVPNDFGTTALHFAVCGHGDTSTAEMLLSAGADINALDGEGASSLYLACERGKTEFVRLLLIHGANPNIAKGRYRCYPLHAACTGLHYDVVKLLLEHNADVDARNENGETALHYIVSLYHTDMGKSSALVQLLLDAGADINAVNDDGESVVCFATINAIEGDFSQSTEERMNRQSAVRLLLQHGANVNVRMPDGRSPLNLTVTALKEAGTRVPEYRTCVIELLRLLVKYGAQLHDSPCPCQLRGNLYRRSFNTLTLTTLGDEGNFIVELFRAGAGLHCWRSVVTL